MTGWEVCRAIREDEALEHTGVIMLTGIGERLNEMTSPLYGGRRVPRQALRVRRPRSPHQERDREARTLGRHGRSPAGAPPAAPTTSSPRRTKRSCSDGSRTASRTAMNNMLATVMGLASVLQTEVEPGSSAADDVRAILEASRRGLELTRGLLAFSDERRLGASPAGHQRAPRRGHELPPALAPRPGSRSRRASLRGTRSCSVTPRGSSTR